MIKRTLTTCLIAVVAIGVPATWAADGAHEGNSGMQSAMAGRHGGVVAHTGARAYELVRHERSAMLFLYTHGMEPLAVRNRAGSAPKEAPMPSRASEGLEVSGTAFVTAGDHESKTFLTPRKDAMTGVTFLHADLPADVPERATIRCEVRVGNENPDMVTFQNPPITPMHGGHGEPQPEAHEGPHAH